MVAWTELSRTRRATLVILFLWMIAAGLAAWLLQPQASHFVRMPQTMATVTDRDGNPHLRVTLPIRSLTFLTQLRQHNEGHRLERERNRIWLTNTYLSEPDYRLLEAPWFALEPLFPRRGESAYLQLSWPSPATELYCGDEDGRRVNDNYRYLDRGGRVQTFSGAAGVPCHYDTLRIQFADGRTAEFPIGSVTVPPHEPRPVLLDYVPRHYVEPTPARSWARAIGYLLILLGLTAAPSLLAALTIDTKWLYQFFHLGLVVATATLNLWMELLPYADAIWQVPLDWLVFVGGYAGAFYCALFAAPSLWQKRTGQSLKMDWPGTDSKQGA